ncbi:MAG: hypothetical protein HW386_835 [Gammaproteobacteria bacterium]|nr:hypothetical protein [Gammaproteobacteria bacterium]
MILETPRKIPSFRGESELLWISLFILAGIYYRLRQDPAASAADSTEQEVTDKRQVIRVFDERADMHVGQTANRHLKGISEFRLVGWG